MNTSRLWCLLAGLLVLTGCDMPEQSSFDNDTLESGLSIQGMVQHDDVPMSDLTIELYRQDGKEALELTTVSNTTGAFTFTDLPEGDYLMVAKHETVDGVYGGMAEFSGYDINYSGATVIELSFFTHEELEEAQQSGFVPKGGVGVGCLGIGCSVKCMFGLRFACCGINMCLAGVEGCVPIGGSCSSF